MLNILSFSHAYSLYPRATLGHRLSLAVIPEEQLKPALRDKYTARGWTFIHTVALPHWAVNIFKEPEQSTNECDQCPHCKAKRDHRRNTAQSFRDGRRWIGDAQSWVLPLSLDGVELPPTSTGVAPLARDPSFVTTWELEWRYDRVDGRLLKVEVCDVPGFSRSYVVSDRRLKRAMQAVRELYGDISSRDEVSDEDRMDEDMDEDGQGRLTR